MRLKFLSFEQPIGEFAITVMSVTDILNITVIERREFDQITLASKGGPQREASFTRINEIARYSETADATFPTPILLALPEGSFTIEEDYIELDNHTAVASVVDGQHRLLGLAKSKKKDEFRIPVVFILDATEEQKALIFAIINGKQTRVSASIIYDLFNVVEGRNPFKTAHEIARALNSTESSPFYRRLKMLGKKLKESNETLSQGTFITHLIKHISNNPSDDFNRSRSGEQMLRRQNSIFNKYFLEDKDEVILKILINLFSAVRDNFPNEWEHPEEFILSKTTGYTGIMKALPEVYKVGLERNDLSYSFFYPLFNKFKQLLLEKNIHLTSDDFQPGSEGEARLRDFIKEALERPD